MKKMCQVLLILVLSLTMCACSSKGEAKSLNIAAAASLKNVYDTELIPMFEKQHNGISITATYASSGDLQTQIENGLDVDVFMSASNKQMEALMNEDLILADTNVQLLENKIVLIVPKDSKLSIASFIDLKDIEGIIAIGDPEFVPAGQYAKEALETLGIWKDVEAQLSLGSDVTAVLHQVSEGSADCGIVYATDAMCMEGVKVVAKAPPASLKKAVIYPVAIIKDCLNEEISKEFIEFLQSEEAKEVFVKYGFTINQ